MAYKALYRTYRPTSFNEVVGQQHVVTTLQNAVKQNKIAHAYLFCGPRGTGKTSIAKLLAKTVNCTDSENAPCGTCENCIEMQNGAHSDIVEIDAASNNGVDEIRDLIEKVKYAPIQGKYKIYIIDEVHMLSTGAFNALLKTLEEPPVHVIFILATTEAHKVLPTIISRCQRYDFTKVSDEDIAKKVKEVLEKENIKYDEEVIWLIADLADGGVRDSLSILDQCIAYSHGEISIEHVNQIYGITSDREKIELVNQILEKEIQKVLDKVRAISEKGMDIKRLTNDLIDLIKEVVIYSFTKDEKMLSKAKKEHAISILDKTDQTKLLNMIDILIETSEKYRNASSVISYFELCLLKMMSTPTKEYVEVVEKKIETKTVVKPIVKEEIPLPAVEEMKENDAVVEEKTEMESQSTLQETPSPVASSSIVVENEYILSLLVGADKTKRESMSLKWNTVSNYLIDMDYAKYANKFADATLNACGDNYIVVGVDHTLIANDINENGEDLNMIAFMEKIFEEKVKVFAVEHHNFKSIVANFRERAQSNTLPEAAKVEFKEVKKPIDKDAVKRLEEIFGKDKFNIVEE